MASPRIAPLLRGGTQWRSTLWATGVIQVGIHGGHVGAEDEANMVSGLACLEYFWDSGVLRWTGRQATMEVASYSGSLSSRYITQEATRNGVFCGEWVPHLVLTTVRLHAPGGQVVNPNTQYRLLCQLGHQIKDVVRWTWNRNGDLYVTALTRQVTAAIRRQIGHLMHLLVLNFPQLLRHGEHGGAIRYFTNSKDHVKLRLTLSESGREEQPEAAEPHQPSVRQARTHRELEHQVQRLVGEHTTVERVHPHPRLARVVYLWVGRRRKTVSRHLFKARIAKKDRERGTGLITKAKDRWASHSSSAAEGLDLLHWRKIRRVVGLTPWGSQLLFRLKHHALSVYDPISAGCHCPHDSCSRAGRVNLFHVFWDCPAVKTIRSVFLSRWRSAGLRLDNPEKAFFSLTLEAMPADILEPTGKFIVECLDDTIGGIGGVVERITAQCWSLGAALYFHSVWRWRVAHFDEHNVVTKEHHEALFASRLRSGHAHIMREHAKGIHGLAIAKAGRVICAVLGGAWTDTSGTHMSTDQVYIMFHTGRTCAETATGISGVMVVRLHTVMGLFQVQYIGGQTDAGNMKSGYRAQHLGLLKGLRVCQRHAWGPVHVVGGNKVVSRQHDTRTPPRAADLKTPYWAARRTADVVGVSSWVVHPRDRLRTAHAIAQVVEITSTGLEWIAHEDPSGGASWAAVLALAADDTLHWQQGFETMQMDGSTGGPV